MSNLLVGGELAMVGGELAMTKHGSIITAWVLSQCVPDALCACTLT